MTQCNQIAVDNEGGLFYFDGSGNATFEDRHYRLTQARCTTSQGTFTDTSGLLNLLAEQQANDIANQVKITYLAGATDTENDAASQTEFGLQRLDLTAAFLGAGDAVSRAQWALTQRKDPHDRPNVPLLGNTSSALLTHVLGRVISDRITITDATGRTGISADFFIEGVSHQVSDGGTLHQVTWQLSPVDVAPYWILSTGALSTTTALAY